MQPQLQSQQPKYRLSMTESVFTVLIYVIVILFTLICLIPFWMVVVGSFTDEGSLRVSGFQLFPQHLSLSSYSYVLKTSQLASSYKVSVFVTVFGTFLAMLLTSMYAYVISSRKVKYRNILAFVTYFTMLFGGGLVGFYMLIANWLDLKDTVWALILPYLLNPFYAFILVSFFRSLPYELNEAATVDGANDIFIFFRIILPISLPAIATVSLFYALHYWNDWWLALLFIDDYKLHPLQMMIRQLLSSVNLNLYVGTNASVNESIPMYGIRFATVCLSIGPILLLYPFLQRYFVKGLTIGSVKG
jgi:putative aldouronate transport system permease protein